jgi:hypothetical protein
MKVRRLRFSGRYFLNIGVGAGVIVFLAACAPGLSGTAKVPTGAVTPITGTPTTPSETSTEVPPSITPTKVPTHTPTPTPEPTPTPTETPEPTLTEEERLDIITRSGFKSKEDWDKQAAEKLGPLADELVYPLLAKQGELMPIEIKNNAELPFMQRRFGEKVGDQFIYDTHVWRVTSIISEPPHIDEETGEIYGKVKTLDPNGNVVELPLSFWKPTTYDGTPGSGEGGQTGQHVIRLGSMNINVDHYTAVYTALISEEFLREAKAGEMVMIWLTDNGYNEDDRLINMQDTCAGNPAWKDCQSYLMERRDELFNKYLEITEEITHKLVNGELQEPIDRIWVLEIHYSRGW